VEAGEAAADPVAELADNDNLELALRGLFILKEQWQSPDAGVKEAARKALAKLAGSKRSSVSQRAQATLNPPAENPVSSRRNRGGVPFRFVPAIAGGARNVSVSSRTVNGHTEMTINEDGTKVTISHSNGRDIVVKITEPPKDGKVQPTKEFTAKDADDLKRMHPEASRFFERYAAGMKIAAGAGLAPIPIPGPAVPAQRVPQRIEPDPVPPPLGLDDARNSLQEIDAAQKELQQLSRRLQDLAANGNADADTIKALAEEVRIATERLKAARLKLLP
jgi:uncharacterized protein YggU (UPF0235/DUF167 family)